MVLNVRLILAFAVGPSMHTGTQYAFISAGGGLCTSPCRNWGGTRARASGGGF